MTDSDAETKHGKVVDGRSNQPDVRIGEQGRAVGTPTFVLVQCTNSKRDESAKARDLYDESRYFRKQRAYAKAQGDEWFVQSAKHGLLRPDERVEPYDQHAGDLGRRERERWARGIARDLNHRVVGAATVEILGGADYADPLTPELERHGIEVKEPLRGLMIGERMAKLERMVNDD